jgi:YD repeat-containing protein
LAGAVLGAGIGFWLGRASAPAEPPAEAAAAGDATAAAEVRAADAADRPAVPPAAVVAGTADSAGATAAASQPGAEAAAGEDVRRLDATISGSLYATLAREVEGREADQLSAQIGRLLVWWLDAHRDVLKGDRVTVVYVPDDGPGGVRILALRYHSTKLGKTLAAYRHQPEGAPYGRYYDAEGREIEKRLQDGPIEHYEQITELMNLAGRRHRGVDFKTDVGTEVRTPHRARVVRRNWNTRYNGYCLELVYVDSGVRALFLHLDKVLDAARPGRVLAAGTPVAHSGNTGRSTAPHLHYELHNRAGRLLNPFDFHPTERRALDGAELERFQQRRQALERALQRAAADPTLTDLRD